MSLYICMQYGKMSPRFHYDLMTLVHVCVTYILRFVILPSCLNGTINPTCQYNHSQYFFVIYYCCKKILSSSRNVIDSTLKYQKAYVGFLSATSSPSTIHPPATYFSSSSDSFSPTTLAACLMNRMYSNTFVRTSASMH